MSILSLLKKKPKQKKLQPISIDMTKYATREELAILKADMLETKRNFILTSLSPRMRKRLLDIIAKQKGGQYGKVKT